MSSRLQWMLIFLLVFAVAVPATAQKRFPGKTWDQIDRPEELGYSSQTLAQAKRFSQSIDTAAVVVVVDGAILYEWGEVKGKFMTHSTRKSFLSALYGNYVRSGKIDPDMSMVDLGIDDVPPLTEVETRATVRDCLKARSGIYHPALYESQGMKALKPKRHSHTPGTYWYYNNWDFNVLCTIFEKSTGKKIFEALEEEIARPIQMEDFTAEDGWYVKGEESIHAAYPFRITARDMARFGLLMLRKGNWKGKQIIPEDWVEESTRYYSDAGLYRCDGYGYMWWVVKHGNRFPHYPYVELPEGSYSARGAGGHIILVIPDYDMVVVHRVDTDKRGHSVSSANAGRLLKMILNAKTR
jgi:CubicO group peptidase (beta-lactamase class C family)